MSYTPMNDAEIDAVWDAFWAPHALTSMTPPDCRRGYGRAIEAAATAPLLARIAELEQEVHNLNWALGTTGYETMATPEQQAEADAACAETQARIVELFTKGKPTYKELEAALAEASKDAQRLDWLDSLNAALNKQNGTTYGWKLILSPNIVRLMVGKQANGFVGDVDLNDANAKGATSCRAAIDAMKGTP